LFIVSLEPERSPAKFVSPNGAATAVASGISTNTIIRIAPSRTFNFNFDIITYPFL
jgi:hypothetical protein